MLENMITSIDRNFAVADVETYSLEGLKQLTFYSANDRTEKKTSGR